MNLFDTAQTVKRWINSCDKSDQLELCEELVKDYVVNRFEGKVDKVELYDAEMTLLIAINERGLILASNQNKMPRIVEGL